MAEWVASGRVIDPILALILLEAVGLLWVWPDAHGRAAVLNLAAGGALMLAVRCALSGWDWRFPALFLALSLPAHLFDLRNRALVRTASKNGR